MEVPVTPLHAGFEDTVRVVVRVRPTCEGDTGREAVAVVDRRHVSVRTSDGNTGQQFACNATFGGEATQEEFFVRSGVVTLMHKAIQGMSTTVFAYGQTGSGKTFTVFGDHDDVRTSMPLFDRDGLLPRAAAHMFEAVEALDDGREYRLSVSFLEVYNEQVYDLLAAGSGTKEALPVRQEPRHSRFFAVGSTVAPCSTPSAMLKAIARGVRARSVASHNLNQRSSRGHCLVTLHVASLPRHGTVITGGEELSYFGKITFCDLAGSERLGMSGSTGVTRAETGQINKSLFTLGKVVSSLSVRARMSSPAYIRRVKSQASLRKRSKRGRGRKPKPPLPPPLPYRDSKLTMLLADSLGGNSMSLMIACCTPTSTAANETFRTLQFAMGVKRIKNKPVVLLDPQERLVANLRLEIKCLKQENLILRTSSTPDMRLPPASAGAALRGGMPGFQPPSPLTVPSDRLASAQSGTRLPSRASASAGAGFGFPEPPGGMAGSAALRTATSFPGVSPPHLSKVAEREEGDDDSYSGYSDSFSSDSGDDDGGGSFPVIVTGGDGTTSSHPPPPAAVLPSLPTSDPRPTVEAAWEPRRPSSPIALYTPSPSPGVSSPAFKAPPVNVPARAAYGVPPPRPAKALVTPQRSAPSVRPPPKAPPSPLPPRAASATVAADTPETLEALLQAGGTLGPPTLERKRSKPQLGTPPPSSLPKDVFLDPAKRARALRRLKKKGGTRRNASDVDDIKRVGRQLMAATNHFSY